MQTTNDRMTEEQLADLANLASQLQAKAEASDDRDTAVMAYAVQRACAELTESRREFRAADATIHNLELNVAQVVAENAGLKSAIDSTIGWQQSTDAENVESIRMLLNIETPATDAYLDEVRAQGVDAAIEKLIKKFEGTVHIGVPVMVLESFAAQLRQGAAHE